MRPQIILARGRIAAPTGSILVDFHNGCFVKDGVIAPNRPVGVTVRFRVIALLLSVPYKISYDDLAEALWGDDPDGGPSKAPDNYVSVVLNHFKFNHPTEGRMRVRDWLGFEVRSYYDKCMHVTWPDRPVLVELRDMVYETNRAGQGGQLGELLTRTRT